MKKNRILAISIFCLWAVAQAEEAQVHFKPVSISGQFDNGQIVGGRTNRREQPPFNGDLSKGINLDGTFFSRTGVWVTQDATVNDRLEIIVGVGGIFWYATPSFKSNPPSQQTQFGPGISQAQGIYTFGDLKNPSAMLQMGYFPYKYNSDAKNLGEYLLRSGTYPSYVVSGGWNMVSSAAYMMQGLRVNVPLWGGKFQSDFLLPMERDLPPLFDISPTYVATVKPVAGIQIGAGVACNHCIAIKPSAETPHDPANRVIKSVTTTYDTAANTYTYAFVRDTTGNYYTFQGVKLMGSVSIDPKAFFPMDFLGPEDLKIYSEVALLGVKNYDYYYNNRWQRMPVMVGINLPTFKLLDVLSVEGEYYNSKFTNDFTGPIYQVLPVWNVDVDATLPADQAALNASDVRRDNWKWSIYGKKKIIKGVEIYAQAASDHIRTFAINGGMLPITTPLTNHNGKDWYYIVRLQFGI